MLVEPRNKGQPGMRGAYGYEITGLSADSPYLLPTQPGWPRLRIERDGIDPDRPSAAKPPGTVGVHESSAEAWITGTDRVEVERSTLTVRFRTDEPLDDEIVVHPYLSLPVAILSFWLGRQTLHGGAFRHAGRGWALLGAREAGKSSTLGWLMGQGLEIVTDDLMVLEEGTLFSGPRSLDLRGDAAEVFGGEDLGKLGNRGRWRLRPGQIASATPLG